MKENIHPQSAGFQNTETPENSIINLQPQSLAPMNQSFTSTAISRGTIDYNCVNCNTGFNSRDLTYCPSCGHDYRNMICVHCGESFPIPSPSTLADPHFIDCPRCGQTNYSTVLPGVTDFLIVTDFPLTEGYGIQERTEYPAALVVTDYPFSNESEVYKYPRLIQYDTSTPLGRERTLPSPSREYPINNLLTKAGPNKRIHVRGLSLMCNTAGTPPGARLHARIRDKRQCLQREAVIVPAKNARELCLFDFDYNDLPFGNDIWLSLWWEKDGVALDREVILPGISWPGAPVWEDKYGEPLSPALTLFGYAFDKITNKPFSVHTAYPTVYPTTDYPVPDIAIPDSITFTLMDEDERNLTYQQGIQGKVNVSHADKADFTFYPDKYPAGTTLRLEFIDLAVPPEQFGNPASIDVTVWPHWNSPPITLNASWYNKNMLRINLQSLALQYVPVQSIMVKVSSRNKFSFFTNSPSCGPVGGVFGYADLPMTAPAILSTERQEANEASRLQTIPEKTDFTAPVMRAAIPTSMPTTAYPTTAYPTTAYPTTAYPTTAYPTTGYPTGYPTIYITNYPTDYLADLNGTNDAATGDDNDNNVPIGMRPTCYCFKEDGTCDDDDLKNGNNATDKDDPGSGSGNGGGGSGGSGGGNRGSGGSSGGVNNGNNPALGWNKSPGINIDYGNLDNKYGMPGGSVLHNDFKTVKVYMSSPGSVNYSHVTQRRVAGINSATNSVLDANKVCIVNEKGYPRFSEFNKSDIKSKPADRSQTQPERLEKVLITKEDGSGLPLQTIWLQETLKDGTIIRYARDTGEPVAIRTPQKGWSKPSDWEQDLRIIYENPDNPTAPAPAPSITNGIQNTLFQRPGNIRQIWNRKDGLLDFTTQSATQYTISRYTPDDVGSYNGINRRYNLKNGAVPVKKWVVQSEFIQYTVKSDGKKYETGTNRLLSENDLKLLRSYTVTEITGEERFVSRWEQPDNRTLIYTRGEGDEAETVVTTRTATDPASWETLRAENQSLDLAYLRVGDTFTREVEEKTVIPGIPGGTRVRHRRYPFGDVCTFRERGTGTPQAQSTTYEYDTNPASRSYGCCIKKTFSSGKVVVMAYDAQKRLIMKREPWAGGPDKITRYTYCCQPEHLFRIASEKEIIHMRGDWASGNRAWEKVISCKQYSYIDTPALKEEKITHTAFAWMDINKKVPADPRISVTQWYGEDSQSNGSMSAHAAGRIKMTRDFSGRETQYRYHDSTEPGIAYICIVSQTADGRGKPGQTTRTTHYYDENNRIVRREEYCNTWQALTMVGSERYTRDSMNRIIRTDKANGKHTSVLWSCNGPVQETDENGISTYYRYNSARRLTGVTQEPPIPVSRSVAEGISPTPLPCRTVEYFYDAAGRRIREQTTIGQTVSSRSTTWDALDRAVSETDEAGLITTHAYSANGLQTTTTQPSGATFVTLYHKDGSVLQEGGTGRQARFYSYNLWPDSLFTRVTLDSSSGPVVQDTFTDGYGQIIMSMTPRGTGKVIRHTLHDKKGNRTFTRTSHQKGGTRMEYDAFGQMIRQTQELPSPHVNRISETSQSYTLRAMSPGFLAGNAPEWFGEPLVWRETQQTTRLDDLDSDVRTSASWELVSETLPHVRHAVLTRSPQGIMTAEWTEDIQGNLFQYKARQGTSRREYAISLGDMTFKQVALSGGCHTWNYRYLENGLEKSVTDGRGNTQTMRHDSAGRVLTQIDAIGGSTRYDYSAATGQLLKTTNPDGKTTCYHRDQRGRVIATYGTAVQPTRVEYDSADRVTALHTWRTPGLTMSDSPLPRTDGDITRWIYDAASGALKQKKMADGSAIEYSYDYTGMMESKKQANGVKILYDNNPLTEQLASMEYDDGTPGVTYVRNDWGDIVSITDASGTRTLTYDTDGVLCDESLSGACEQTLMYGLDEQGLAEGYRLTLDGAVRQELHCNYGDALRVSRIETRDGGEYAWTWKADAPLLEKLDMPNGITRTYGYDPQRDLLTNIRYSKTGGDLYKHAYSYDLLGRLTSRDSGAGTARHHDYAYNDRGEVTGHTLTGGDRWTYSYDNIGNRIRSFKNADNRNYTANALNQYTRIDSTGSQGTETVLPAYDPDGNQIQVSTSSGNWTVTWNAENRPIAFVQRDRRVECIYDHMGRRVQKTTLLKGVPVSCRRYAYKGYQLVAELDAMDKSDHPELLKSWTWDPTRGENATPLEASFWRNETGYPTTAYPTTAYPTTAYPTTAYPAKNAMFPGLLTGAAIPISGNDTSMMDSNILRGKTISPPPALVTLYGEEFCETSYPDNEAVYPSEWPTFYPGYPDTVWIRKNSPQTSISESSNAVRFNLGADLPADKDLVIDSLELLLYSADSGLTMELYLDNKLLLSLPYRLYTITSIDLKALGISEEKRTLSYRKNIMVRFSKNGRPYLKMGICCASPGLPAGHVRGRLKDRDQTGNPRPVATYQYLTDHNKNVTGLTDSQGNLVATWDYDAFGNTIHQTGSQVNSNPLRFSSEYHDEDLGLIYYNYRHYNPRDGRWISRDPIEEKGGINLYVVIKNNTPNYFDKLGLIKEGDNCSKCCKGCTISGNQTNLRISDTGSTDFNLKFSIIDPPKFKSECKHGGSCEKNCCYIYYRWFTCYTGICYDQKTENFEKEIIPNPNVKAWSAVSTSLKGFAWCSCENGKWKCHNIEFTSNVLNYSIDSEQKPTKWILRNPKKS